MEVDKSRAALTSGETLLPLCGDEAKLTSRAALTSGETPLPLLRGRSGKGISQSATGGDPSRLEKRGEAAYAFQSMVNI